MLSFEVKNFGKEIQIHCDDEGVALLISRLEEGRSSGGHIHLRTPSIGGEELCGKTPWDKDAVPEVIINFGD